MIMQKRISRHCLEITKRFKVVKGAALTFVGAVLGFSSCANPASIEGVLTGVKSDTLLVFASHMNERESFRKDTIALVNGRFEIQYPDSALLVSLVAKPAAPNGAIRMPMSGPIYFFPGDKLQIEGDINDFNVSGSELYDGLQSYAEIQRMQLEFTKLSTEFMDVYKSNDKDEIASIRKQLKAVRDSLQHAKFEAVKANPRSLAAAYFACQLQPEQGLAAIDLLSDDLKNGPMGKVIKKTQQSYTNALIREKAKEQMKPGNKAPEFHGVTIDGKEVNLDTFQGKYLLVDFWGTWCGWCIKGIPTMKKYYNKYNRYIEFLGVCCGDTDAKWRACVAQHQLPWVNINEGESGMSSHFAVAGYPTKILLDPQGEIVEIFVGETPKLYEKLDALFAK